MDRSSNKSGGWRFVRTVEGDSADWQTAAPKDTNEDRPGPSLQRSASADNAEHWAFGSLQIDHELTAVEVSAHVAAESALLFIDGKQHLPASRESHSVRFTIEKLPPGNHHLAIRLQGPSAADGLIGFYDAPNIDFPSDRRISLIYIQPDLRRNRITVSATGPKGATLRHTIVDTAHSAEGPPAKTIVEFTDYEPWPTRTDVYILRSECIVDGKVTDTRETPFAMREVTLREGRLFVNGRPMPLRMVDYDPAIALLNEVDSAAGIRRDLAAAHDAGFNAIRVPSNTCTTVTLDTATQLGLTVMVKFPFGVPTDTIAATVDTWRNEPAIVAWIIQCSTPDGEKVHDAPWAIDTLTRIHAIDPSRTAFAIAHEGDSQMWRPYRDATEPCRFVRTSLRAPLTPETEKQLNSLKPGAPYILDAIAVGAWTDAAEAMASEAATASAWSDAPRDWAATLGKSHADTVERVLRAARGNTTAIGYVYSPLRDDDGQITGLINSAGKAKPALAAAKAAHAAMAITLRGEQSTLAPREEMSLALHLLSDSRTEEQAQLSLQVVGPTGQVLWKKMRDLRIGKSRKPLWDGRVAGSGKAGTHTFVARLKLGGRIVAQASYPFAVIDHPEKAAPRVGLIDPEGRFRSVVSEFCKLASDQVDVHILPRLANTVRAYPADEVAHALGQVRVGSALIVFSPPHDWNDLAARVDDAIAINTHPPITLADGIDGIASLHPIFDGIPTKCLLGSAHAGLCGERLFEGPTDDSVQVYAMRSPSEDAIPAHGVIVRRYGSGRITFVAASVIDRLGHDPAAERYLTNLISHAARRSVHPEEEAPLVIGASSWLSETIDELSRWRVRPATTREASNEPLTNCPPTDADVGAESIASWYLMPEGGTIDLEECLGGIYSESIIYADARAVLDRRVAAKFHLRYPGEVTVWVNERIAEFDEQENSINERVATLNLNAGRNRICIGFRATPPDTAPAIRVLTDDGFPLRGVHWR